MRRREVVGILAVCVAGRHVAHAQTSSRPLRVGAVSAANNRTTSFWITFIKRMAELGYVEGQNFALDFTSLEGQLDLYTDQLLRDAFPDLRSATVLWDRVSADQWRIAQQVGPKLGLRLIGIELSGATQDYERLLGEAPAADRGALVVLMTPAVFPHRARLAEAAIRLGMPSVSGYGLTQRPAAFS